MQREEHKEKIIAKKHEFEQYVNLNIQWTRWILKSIGLWPKSRSTMDKYIYRLINVLCYSLTAYMFIPCSLYIFLEVEVVYDKIRLFGALNFCLMAFLKYCLLNVHEEDIRECIERIEWDWKNVTYSSDREVMIENANFGRKLVMICIFFMYSGFVFYYIAIPISVGKVPADDKNLSFIPMMFPFSKFIIDTRESPINELCFSFQVLAGALMHSITAAACSLAAVLATHACGQIQVLINWLHHLIDGRSDMEDNVDRRITMIVNHHVQLLKFLALINKTLQSVSFVEFLGSMLNICLLGYYVIMETSANHLTTAMTYLVILISLVFNIFIYCYIGELVAEQCKQIGEVSYMVNWYQLTGSKKLSVVLIIAMANASVKLTAGNMVDLCLTTFSDVVKTAVAFLNALRTLT